MVRNRQSPFVLAFVLGVSACESPTPPPSLDLEVASAQQTLIQAATLTVAVTVTTANLPSDVTLTATGLPNGVTASFAAASATTGATHTLTLTSTATATPATVDVTVEASAQGVEPQSATFPLTVVVRGTFSMSTSPQTASMGQGGTSEASTIGIDRLSGFAQDVTLSATGLPSGVTANFTPAVVALGTSTATVTFTAAGTATPATTEVQIVALTPGLGPISNTVAVTVLPPPAIAVSLGAGTVSIIQNATGSIDVSVARTNFAGDISFSASGLPEGATASFSPATLSGSGASSTLTISASGTAAVGQKTVTVQASGSGVETNSVTFDLTILQRAITLSLDKSALAITQGESGTLAVSLSRTNFTGDVTLSASGLPTGVTASFDPAALTGSKTSSTLTLAATTTAEPGTKTITVQASGTGVEPSSKTFSLTVNVAGTYSLTASPTSVTLDQGASQTATITVARASSFAQAVVLTATGLPAGVTAHFSPASVTGGSSVLTLAASGTATIGSGDVTVTGTTPGLSDQTTKITLTVQMTTPISIDFCAGAPALWFAYQNEGGSWTQVIPNGSGTVSFNATGKIAIAYTRARQNFVGTTFTGRITTVLYTTATELQTLSGITCVNEIGTRSVTVSAAGLGAGDGASIFYHRSGRGLAAASPSGITNRIPSVAFDFVATRTPSGGVPSAVIVRRGVTHADGDIVPTFDFAGSDATALPTTTYSVTGRKESNEIIEATYWTTATGTGLSTAAILASLSGSAATASGTFPHVPSLLTQAGDVHQLQVFSGATTDMIGALSVFQNGAGQTLALGPSLNDPTVTQIASSPAPRFRTVWASQAEYSKAVSFLVRSFSTQTKNAFLIDATQSFFGGAPASWDLTMPDFTGVSGWDSAWNLEAGQSLTIDVVGWSESYVYIAPASIDQVNLLSERRPFPAGSLVRFAQRRSSHTAAP